MAEKNNVDAAAAAAAAAKSCQSCLTLCDPIDGSPPGSPVPGSFQARTLEWVAISFSNEWKWKWSLSVVSNSQRPHGLQPTRLLRPWNFPGESTRVGRQCLLLMWMGPCLLSTYVSAEVSLSWLTGRNGSWRSMVPTLVSKPGTSKISWVAFPIWAPWQFPRNFHWLGFFCPFQ